MSPRQKPVTVEDLVVELLPVVRTLKAMLVRLEDVLELAARPGYGEPVHAVSKAEPMVEHVKPKTPAGAKVTTLSPTMRVAERTPPSPSRAAAGTRQAAAGDDELSKMERALLTAAAQYSARPLTSAQLASYAGYSRRNGDISVALARLRREDYLSGTSITAKGRDALGHHEPLPTGAALRRHWLEKLASDIVARRFLEVVCEAFPAALVLEDACDRAGYSRTNGDVSVALAKLRRLDLISQRQPLRASPMLFDGA